MFSQNLPSIEYFHKILFCGSLGISLPIGRNACRDKVAYSRISPNPEKEGPTLGGVVIVVVVVKHMLEKSYT